MEERFFVMTSTSFAGVIIPDYRKLRGPVCGESPGLNRFQE
jgi:hypothetical protein